MDTLNLFRISITSWTASFRYPNIISGYQPTLEVPPLSTVLGLINAAAGSYLYHKKLLLGFYFEFGAKGIDLETIYQIQSNNGKPTNSAKSNVMNREFLFENKLVVYTPDKNIAGYFQNPVYPLVLGRSNDLASVIKIEEVQLAKKENADKVKGQIIPFLKNQLAGQIQALPKYFTNNFPRKNIGTEPYSIVSCSVTQTSKSNLIGYHDETLGLSGVDIYLHDLDFSEYD